MSAAAREGGRLNPRVEKLRRMLDASPDDAFLLYALAMECKRDDAPKALELLQRVIQLEPLHSYAYFQLGQVHESAGRTDEAREIYQQGMTAAARAGDEHARSELAGALNALGD